MPPQPQFTLPASTPTNRRARRAMHAVATVVACAAIAACSGATAGSLGGTRAAQEGSPTERYVASLRLAALARVELRAGADELAAEHFRAAYRKHAHVDYLIGAATAAERAKLVAEAHDALRQALTHDLPADDRARIEKDAARLEVLVPAALVRVAVQVQPEGARVELTRQQPGEAARDPRKAGTARAWDRVVLGTGWVFLQPGTWAVYSTAKGYQSELQTAQVSADGGEFVAVGLLLEDTGPALGDPARPRDARPSDVAAPGDRKPAEPEGPVVEFGVKKSTRSAIHGWGPLVTSAIGVAAIGAGGWFGFQATLHAGAANDLANQNLSKAAYDESLANSVTQAQDSAQLATYAFIGGGALVAVGSLWWLLAPVDAPPSDGPTVGAAAPSWRDWLPAPTLAPMGAGLAWRF